MKWIYDLSHDELQKDINKIGLKKFVSRQLLNWLLQKNIRDSSKWVNISKKNRDLVLKNFNTELNDIVKKEEDTSGTKKFLIELKDGYRIESVLIREKNHYTFCISSQVGCALGCRFCATGKMGLKRNLSQGEILSQILLLKEEISGYKGKLNLVFMGMGEPLVNYENLKKALLMITDPFGMEISPRNITISTSGIIKNLALLEEDFPNVKISISLNGPDDRIREDLMPVSKKEKLGDLITYLKSRKRKHRITFEYVLIKNINDSPEEGRKIVKLLRGIPCKINIIPYNESKLIEFETPPEKKVDEFAEFLASKGYTVMVRWSKGKDIKSACGQLAGE
ncbi:MAG: 23S rRNA (adenine(2503)-C(2))-methyltransferase RlmN [Acidobacteriota bacterium]